MKKILALILVILMCFALVACSNDNDDKDSKKSKNDPVAEFIEENGEDLADKFEEGYSQAGMTCDAEVSADGNDIVFDVKLNGINDLTQEQKDLIATSLKTSMSSELDGLLEDAQDDCSKVENLIFHIREEDGDKITTLSTED